MLTFWCYQSPDIDAHGRGFCITQISPDPYTWPMPLFLVTLLASQAITEASSLLWSYVSSLAGWNIPGSRWPGPQSERDAVRLYCSRLRGSGIPTNRSPTKRQSPQPQPDDRSPSPFHEPHACPSEKSYTWQKAYSWVPCTCTSANKQLIRNSKCLALVSWIWGIWDRVLKEIFF